MALLLKAIRFAGLLLMGAQVGVSYSHALQARGKRRLPTGDFLRVQNVLLGNYALGVGALEVGAMLSTLGAAALARGGGGGEGHGVAASNLVALACSAAMFGVWARFIEPINREVRGWTPEAVPEGWEERRERWHSLHALRLLFAVVGFVALVLSALGGTGRDECAEER